MIEADQYAHPGLRDDISNADYHRIDALSASGLKRLARSPAHYWANTLDPQRPPNEPTEAMKAGTLAHCAILEPHALAERYIVRPAGLMFTTKEGKAWRDAQPAGVEIVTTEQMLTATRQAASVRQLPEVAALLERGQPEVSAFWFDEPSGLLMKCRPDSVALAGERSVVLLDVKTTQDASPDAFSRSIWNFGYHLLAAHYSEGYEIASGLMVLGFAFVVVEADYPHAAAAYLIDDDGMARARRTRRRLIESYAVCRATGEWPGYPNTMQPISLPGWARDA